MPDTRTVTEQMNSDMFDHIERETYDVSGFSELEIAQARESFHYNGYRSFLNNNILNVKK